MGTMIKRKYTMGRVILWFIYGAQALDEERDFNDKDLNNLIKEVAFRAHIASWGRKQYYINIRNGQ